MPVKLDSLDAKLLLCIETSSKVLTVNDIAKAINLATSTVSNRTKGLEEENYLHRSKEGKRVLHFLTDAGKIVLDNWKKSPDAKFLLDSYLEEIHENLGTG